MYDKYPLTRTKKPTESQKEWLKKGLDQPGGKLPLFDSDGQKVSPRTVDSCIRQGWAEKWFDNPTKPDLQVRKITETGGEILKV